MHPLSLSFSCTLFVVNSVPKHKKKQVNGKNQLPAPGEEPLKFGERSNLPLERVLGLVTDAFTGATEREIYVGDMMELFVIKVLRDENGKMKGSEMGVLRKALKRD